MNGNASFVGFDEETGSIYRIEINKNITGRANHIRSVFEITPSNYNEIKLEPPRVLQPSKTALLKGRAATMTISNFMNKIPPNDSKVNPTSAKNPENSSTDSAFSLSADSSYADRMAEIKAEMQQLKKKYEGTDQWMKAPNGKPTNLTEFQWLQVRTKAFKECFGDWENDPENASKVVDENGEPLVVYNGGKSGISIFDIEQTGKSNEFAKVGFWFSDEKSLADSFAKNWYNQTWNGKEYAPGNVYAVYLNIKNPKIYELELTHKMLQGVLRNYHDFSQVN